MPIRQLGGAIFASTFSVVCELGDLPRSYPQQCGRVVDDEALRLQRCRRSFRLHLRLYGGSGLRSDDARAWILSRRDPAAFACLAALRGSRPSVRDICRVDWIYRAHLRTLAPPRRIQRRPSHQESACHTGAWLNSWIQAAESRRAASVHRADGRLPACALGDDRRPDRALAVSLVLYFASRHFGWNLPSFPSGVWYFNPFAWQLLFTLGAWAALGGAARCRSPDRI